VATLNIKNLPDPLYESLKLRADAQHRSIAQEVTHILSEVLNRDQRLSILDLQGLGKELWTGIDAAQHVADERDSWD
jgi:plasmid stability protein